MAGVGAGYKDEGVRAKYSVALKAEVESFSESIREKVSKGISCPVCIRVASDFASTVIFVSQPIVACSFLSNFLFYLLPLLYNCTD